MHHSSKILFSLLLTSFAFGDTGIDTTSPIDCTNKTPDPMRITMRHIEGNGVGYNQGYSTLEGFFTLPATLDKPWIPFLDLRGHIFNNGKPAANAGVGLRYLSSRVWGINTYYDYRKTSHLNYNQISVGLESLGRLLDFRINGYLPVGQKAQRYDTKMDGFKGNYLILSRKKEFDMKGANAEMGVHITNNKYAALYAAAGPYYLDYKGINAWGGEFRLGLDITDYIKIEGNTSYDNIFNWIAQGQFSVNIPFGGKETVRPKGGRSWKNEGSMMARALQRVDRNEIIVIDKKTQKRNAIDPTTGRPYYFVFVDNTSHSNGTFESPYNTLLAAQNNSSPNDIIYVYPGDGTTTGMDAGITLQDSQRLLSSSFNHVVNTTWGNFTIAATTNALPQVTNLTTASNVVQLANNNEVSGFKILNNNSGGDGITTGSRTATTNFIATHNTILGDDHSETYGINLFNTDGSITITDNSFVDQSIATLIQGNSLSDTNYLISTNNMSSSSYGMFIHFSDCSNVSTSILGNTIAAINRNLDYQQTNSTLVAQNNLLVEDNNFTCTFSNLTTSAEGTGNLAITIANNTLSSASATGNRHVFSDSSKVTLAVNNNTVTANTICTSITTSDTVNLVATISNNVMEAATGDGFTNSLNDSSVVTLTINANTLTTHSAGSSNRITSSDDVTLIATISDNQVTSTSGSGFSQTFNDSSIGTVTINNNNINVSLFGLSLAENNTANVTYTATNNTLSNSSGTNMGLTLSDFSVVNATVSDNTIASVGIGLSTSASDQTNATYVINNNDVSSSTNSAMRLGSTGLAVTSATV
ncbi:MAG: hypothetical protein JSS09_03745, partial [Verrucomicrobia bacterium]|nr:hypothetical protein [Verrucomicrobiota bacterium]